jgi:hypothetical protein
MLASQRVTAVYAISSLAALAATAATIANMIKFLLGIVVGIVAATVGFSEMAKVADRGVAEVQAAAKNIAK